MSTRVLNNSADPLDPEWFRLHGHELIDFIADYRAQLNDPHSASAATPTQLPPLPIQCQLQPGWLARALPTSAPSQPEPWSAVLADVKSHIVPGLTHWQSPHFYAWFKNHASYPSFLGDMLSSAFSAVGFSWLSSPASAELEAVVMDWCATLFALPQHFYTKSGKGGGSICQTAGEAGIIGLLTAKRKAMEGYEEGKVEDSVREDRERRLVLYVSDQAHGVLGRAVKVAGLPKSRMRVIKTKREDDWRMSAEDVDAAMAADEAAGLIPFFLWLTIGTTSSAAIDDMPSLCAVGARHAAWVHADGAYGGVYAMLPELQRRHFDWCSVNSVNINAHKGLFTHFDCAFLWVDDRYFLTNALTLPGMHILRNAHSDAGTVIDYKDWGLSFGRRFRSLKVWCMLRCLGADRVRQMLQWSIDGAREMGEALLSDGRFELMEAQLLGLLCFRVKDGVVKRSTDVNAANKALMDRCNAGGEVFFSLTVLDGATVLRLATSGVETREQLMRDVGVIVKNLSAMVAEARTNGM